MAHATPFHAKDPQFHKDISFYTFDLPFYRFLLNFGFAAVILSLVAATAVHYLYGGLRITSPGARVTSAATGHLAVLLGLFVSLKAAAYWLDRYSLAVRSSGFRTTDKWTGLRYVDANAYLPAKTILFFIAVICALLFFTTLWRRTWTLPTIGFGLMVLSAILIGGLYPAIVQKFQVLPNEAAKEAPYVQKNIDATRAAYGLTKTEVTPYPGKPHGEGGRRRGEPRGHRHTAGRRGRLGQPAGPRPEPGLADLPGAPAEQRLLPVPLDPGRRPRRMAAPARTASSACAS